MPPVEIKENLKPNDAIGIKVFVVVGHAGDYAAYYGPAEWPDEMVLRSGDKVPRSVASKLFTTLARTLNYRS